MKAGKQNQGTYYLFSDGGSRGNPGPSGAGVVIKDSSKKIVFSVSEYLGELTNNQAEYQALILGLKKASDVSIKNIECFLDSELLVKQLNGEYRVRDEKIKELYVLALELKKAFKKVTFTHIKREKNKEADELVNKALDLKLSTIEKEK